MESTPSHVARQARANPRCAHHTRRTAVGNQRAGRSRGSAATPQRTHEKAVRRIVSTCCAAITLWQAPCRACQVPRYSHFGTGVGRSFRKSLESPTSPPRAEPSPEPALHASLTPSIMHPQGPERSCHGSAARTTRRPTARSPGMPRRRPRGLFPRAHRYGKVVGLEPRGLRGAHSAVARAGRWCIGSFAARQGDRRKDGGVRRRARWEGRGTARSAPMVPLLPHTRIGRGRRCAGSRIWPPHRRRPAGRCANDLACHASAPAGVGRGTGGRRLGRLRDHAPCIQASSVGSKCGSPRGPARFLIEEPGNAGDRRRRAR
jgi:hypothetical protein